MDGQTPSIQTQLGNQPVQPTAGAIPQAQPTSTPPQFNQPWYKAAIQTVIANKSLAIFLTMGTLSSFMTTYIILSPSNKTLPKRATAFSTPNTPTPLPALPISSESTTTPTALPSASPTEIPPTPEPTIEPTDVPLPTPTPDPTANWNTYINTQYSYTIKYPLNWSALDLGVLEPKVPSYVAFNMNTASTSARSITISVSTRTYEEQLAINGSTGSDFTAGGIEGTWQSLKDSDGNASVAVTLPLGNTILILRAKSAYVTTLLQMLPTLYINK